MLKYHHVRSECLDPFFGKKSRQFCICYKQDQTRFIQFSVSVCSNKDQYNKKKAREIAKQRMDRFESWILPKTHKKMYDNLTTLENLIAMNPKAFCIKLEGF